MSNQGLRIAFMGTPDFALEALKALHTSNHDVVCVYSQPPRPKGRGKKVQLSPVHQYAQDQNIPVFTPKSLKHEDSQAEFVAHDIDIAVVAAYGLILPQAVLDSPKYGCLNIHASLLPRWRGAAPIQYAIWQGDQKTGITIMQMEAGLDTGPMIVKSELDITSDTTAPDLHDALAAIGADMIVDVLNQVATEGTISSEKQDDNLSTYASMLKKEDGIIDWSQSAIDIDRQIRALNPWPGVYTSTEGRRFKILEAKVEDEISQKEAGIILDKAGLVSCGNGTVLSISRLQPDGKKPMDVTSALNGNYLELGCLFDQKPRVQDP